MAQGLSTGQATEWNTWGRFPPSVAVLGDLDGDSTPDFAVSAVSHVYDTPTGCVLVLSGATCEVLRRLVAPRDAEKPGEPYATEFGRSIAQAGDLDGDGRSEIAVGAPRSLSVNSEQTISYVAIYDGASGAHVRTITLSMRDAGWSLALAGDTDGNGSADLVTGTPDSRVLVLDPTDGRTLHRFRGLTGLTYGFGWSVAGPGDLDGDGHADLLVGQRELFTDDGHAYYWAVFSGKSGDLLHRELKRTWVCVSGLGDVSGDGVPDLALGYELMDRVEIVSGADREVLRTVRAPKD